MTRMNSFINAGLMSQKSLDAIESFAKQANEVPERVLVKYRRTLEQHEMMMRDIPHAYPTVRSKHRNTMFPSGAVKYYYFMLSLLLKLCSGCNVSREEKSPGRRRDK